MFVDFNGLQAKYDNEHTLYIKSCGNRLQMTIEPAYRFNGTQVLDGLLPRTYGTVGAAKGAATKMLADDLIWQEIEARQS